MGWAYAFLIASGTLTLGAIWLKKMRQGFAWKLFFTVAKWVFVLTSVFTAMGVYIMAYDKLRGTTLLVMIAVLLLAAVNVPILIGFAVGRHERVAN